MNIIVSGASRGIGKSIVEQLSRREVNVLALSRSSINEKKRNVDYLSVDLSNEKSFATLLERINKWKSVDVVINNAGQLINKPFIETSIHEFKLQFDANYFTAVNLIKVCYEKLHSRSHIVNISSMGGFQGSAKYPGLSAYSSSKGALINLTECLAEEFKENKKGNINALALGAVQTEMLDQAFPGYKAPLKAEEMAEYIIDFALNQNKYFNGKVLPVALINP